MRPSHLLAPVIAVSMFLSVFSFVPFTGSAQPMAALLPPCLEYVQDTDSDGLIDYLVFDVPFEVYEAGDYTVSLLLEDSEGVHIFGYNPTRYWEVGTHFETCPIEGIRIWDHGVDGPYVAHVLLYAYPGEQIDEYFQDTQPYAVTDFEPLPAMFEGTLEASGLDVDGNDRFEFLEIDVDIEVLEENDYTIRCSILKWAGSSWVRIRDSEVEVFHLLPGAQVVTLSVRGSYINAAEQDGPYYFHPSLYDPADDYLRFLDSLSYQGGDFSYVDFEAGSFSSPLSTSAPVIDGAFGDDEWADAKLVDLARPDMENPFGAALLVKSNLTHMFVCIDVVSDLTEDGGDSAAISFDTDNDNVITDGREDQFLIGAFPPHQSIHLVYSETEADWVAHCAPLDPTLPDHEGVDAAAGFGASSGNVNEHRIFELAVPFALIGAEPGAEIGLAATSSLLPGVFDETRNDGSSWPYYMEVNSSLIHYGDVLLGWPPLVTTASLSGTLGLGGWYVSPVTVALSCTGGQLGYDSSTYKLDLGDWTAYTSPILCGEDGVHFLWYQSQDNGGNEDEMRFLEFSVDAHKPMTSASVSGANVTLTATDNASGVSRTVYRVDGGSWTNYTGPFGVSRDVNHTVEFYSVDVAGNVEETMTLEVDEEDGGGGTLFDMNFFMVLAIIAMIMLISIGAILGMRRRAKESDSKAAIKDIGSPYSQMMMEEPPKPPDKGK